MSTGSRINVNFAEVWSGRLERAMGNELYPEFLSLAETRCYQPLWESMLPNVAKAGCGLVTCPGVATRAHPWPTPASPYRQSREANLALPGI